jgi:hypothetical protein
MIIITYKFEFQNYYGIIDFIIVNIIISKIRKNVIYSKINFDENIYN